MIAPGAVNAHHQSVFLIALSDCPSHYKWSRTTSSISNCAVTQVSFGIIQAAEADSSSDRRFRQHLYVYSVQSVNSALQECQL